MNPVRTVSIPSPYSRNIAVAPPPERKLKRA
jgi:hypothetical protein